MITVNARMTITSILSLAAGACGGYFFAKHQLEKIFDERLETELEKTKKYYQERNLNNQPFATPEEAVKNLIPPDEAERMAKAGHALRVYSGVGGEQEAASVIVRNVMDTPQDGTYGVERRNPNRPYKIEEDEFFQSDLEYSQITLTYYVMDETLTDERDAIVELAEKMVGNDLHEHFTVDPDLTVVYIRNEALRTDFEIARGNSYAQDVAGLGT
jgi:hypothetical protein